jgi:two-component system, NarL family, nitrate/nitrite response regulator NarL
VTREQRIRVLIVDDNGLFRDGLVGLLGRIEDIEVVGAAGSGEEALRRAPVLRPNVVLMDLAMPGMGGVEATRQMLENHPGVAVCMLTVSEQERDLFAAVRAGARGYLVKSVELDVLATAIRTLSEGGALISPHLARDLLSAFAQFSPPPKDSATDRLTPREREILALVGRGMSNPEIADRLVIAENTVKVHLRNILDKLQVHSRAQAAAIAAQAGLTGRIRPGDDPADIDDN